MESFAVLALGAAAAGELTGCKGIPQDEDGPNARMLRHVVLFAWKEGTPPVTIRSIEDAFRALPGKIGAIADFEWGTDVSVENLADGYTHTFLVSFRSEEDRAAYLPHAAHRAFVELIKPHMAKVLVIDYWQSR